MVTYRKVYDPGETSRRLNLIVRLPETLAGLSEAPYRQEALLIDHILQQWVISQIGSKPLEQAIQDGTLRSSIEQALDQAKKGRANRAPSHASSRHPPASASNSGVGLAHHSPAPQPETVTVTPVTPPETQPVIAPETPQPDAVTAPPAARQPDPQAPQIEETPQAEPAKQTDDDPPPPPAGVANRLNSMFEDF